MGEVSSALELHVRGCELTAAPAGGAQNIKMKAKEDDKAPVKPQKSGVLRGLKGIM